MLNEQLPIEFKPRCVVPDPDTGCGRLLRALQRGMRPTIVTARARAWDRRSQPAHRRSTAHGLADSGREGAG